MTRAAFPERRITLRWASTMRLPPGTGQGGVYVVLLRRIRCGWGLRSSPSLIMMMHTVGVRVRVRVGLGLAYGRGSACEGALDSGNAECDVPHECSLWVGLHSCTL